MKTLITAALLILVGTSAKATDLKVSCTVTENNDPVLETVIKPTLNGYGKIGDIDGYSFRIRNNDGSRVSLEIFDIAGEGRYYADATLVKAGDSVVNTIWRRDILLEVTCQIPE
ncbi:hypothetical protein ACLVWU_02440 [Bdellovibrio sp. HCB290]|uniref:hypothetical protein n=1 Tax=Bdellovibrio sp. HCB290 TaxID=3394356 RepID=UPI0039B4B268